MEFLASYDMRTYIRLKAYWCYNINNISNMSLSEAENSFQARLLSSCINTSQATKDLPLHVRVNLHHQYTHRSLCVHLWVQMFHKASMLEFCCWSIH